MPTDPHPLREGHRARLARALGVTRVARVTGLDRTGVEVASAIRPGGHVLQVTNGKGETLGEAADGALAEAAELAAAERRAPPEETLALASAAELSRRVGAAAAVYAPSELEAGARDGDRLRIAWRAARGLLGPAAVWVPEAAVSCPPPGTPPAGLAAIRWTSNGMGAHPRRDAALRHALLEAVERDQLARALPLGFTLREVARRAIAPETLPAAAPRTAALAARLRARGFGVHLLDCAPRLGGRTGPLDLGLPVAAALLVDVEGGPVPVAAGYACRLSRDDALRAALLEAAQSRATEIHGAREDVLVGDRAAAAPLRALLARARPARDARSMPGWRAAGDAAAVRLVLGRLARAGLGRAAAVELGAPGGLAVVRAIVPGLRVSELL